MNPKYPYLGRTALALATLLGAARLSAAYNVRDYGAKGDRSVNDQAAIQAAIDACAKAGGGEVLVPPGNYSAGRIDLRSEVTLNLEAGATIWSTDKIADFDAHPSPREHGYLIMADGQRNISVVGDGTLEGTGQADLGRRTGQYSAKLPAHRFGMIRFTRCRDVRLRDFRILFSEAHTVNFSDCDNVSVIGISILNNFLRTNTDGIDPESCRNVLISDCRLVCGDDCICPKADRSGPMENLVVQNCVLESVAGAIKFGTGSRGDFRDIQVTNCVIRNSGVGIGLFIKDGGTVERASFSNIVIETTTQDTPVHSQLRSTIIPIYVDLGKRTPNSPLSRIRDVSFSDIQIASDNGILIQGLAQRPLENITLRNISFQVNAPFDFSQRTKREGGDSTYRDENFTRFVRLPTYVSLAHVRGLTVDGLRVVMTPEILRQYDRSALSVVDAQDAVIRDVQREPAGTAGGGPVLSLEDCRQVLVADCLALPGTPEFLRLSGARTGNIALAADDLSGASTPVALGSEVPAGALRR